MDKKSKIGSLLPHEEIIIRSSAPMMPNVLTKKDVKMFSSELPKIDIKIKRMELMGKFIQIEFEDDFKQSVPASVSSRMNIKLDTYNIPTNIIHKLPHEMCLLAWTGSYGDVKISTSFSWVGEGSELTPDIIKKLDNRSYAIVELKTRNVYDLSERNIFNALNEMKIYEETIKKIIDTRQGMRACFHPLILSYKHICTSLALTNADLADLSYGFSFGLKLQKLINSKIKIPQESSIEITDFKEKMFDSIIDFEDSLTLIEKKHFENQNLPFIKKSDMFRWATVKKTEYSTFSKSVFDLEFEKVNGELPSIIDFNNEKSKKLFIQRREEVVNKNMKPWLDNLRKQDPSHVIKHPLIVCKPNKFVSMNLPKGNNLISEMFRDALTQTRGIFGETEEESKLLKAHGLEYEQEMKIEKERYKVQLELSEEQCLELARVGIEGKRYKDYLEIKNLKREKQLPYSWDTEVDDISSFIKYFSLGSEYVDFKPKCLPLLEKAISESQGNVEINRMPLDFVVKFCSTKFGYSLFIFNLIVQEVNVSLRTNVKHKEFIIKRIPDHNIFLLIKTTTATKQVFVSIYCAEDDYDFSYLSDSVIRRENPSGFFTMNYHKISHLLNIHVKAASLLSSTMNSFDYPCDVNLFNEEIIIKHFCFSILVMLEDKEETSVGIQKLRFPYSEIVKRGMIPVLLDPLKIGESISDRMRSRLHLWVNKRFIEVFQRMIENVPQFKIVKSTESEISRDSLINMISIVEDLELPTFRATLNLFYNCMLHNKDESEEVSGYTKMFKKVIQEELKMEEAEEVKMGLVNTIECDKLKSHEFSPNFVVAMSESIKRKISELHGDYFSWFSDTVPSKLYNQTLEFLSTLKSSAVILEDDSYDAELEMNLRVKVIENIYNLITSNSNYNRKHIFEVIGELTLSLVSEKVRANLFRKLQIGGVREIYVLTIISRICINFVETISRTICEVIEFEMLTKGTQKRKILDSHYHNVSRKSKDFGLDKIVTVTNSDDCKTWAQQFVMPVFGVMFSRLLPKGYHNIVRTILNCNTFKKLELPKKLLDLMLKHQEVPLIMEEMKELRGQFLGTINRNNLINKNGVFLKNKSNFMQGIWHYTSSIIQMGYLSLFSDYINYHVINVESQMSCVVSTPGSSDDSALILSILTKTKLSKIERAENLCLIFSMMKWRIYPQFCARISCEKSTPFQMNGIVEFNSTWHVKNSILSAPIKFVFSAITSTKTANIKQRFEECSNARSSMLAENCSFDLISIVQVCQAIIHYSNLGSDLSKDWNNFQDRMLETPIVHLGYFPFESANSVGILGSRSAIYNMLKSNLSSQSVYREVSRIVGVNDEKTNRPNFRISLRVSRNSQFGEKKMIQGKGIRTLSKYESFKEKMGVDYEEILYKTDKNPRLLYIKQDNIEENKLSLQLKAIAGGVEDTFNFKTESMVHAMSVYILNTQCLMIKEDEENSKLSLIEAIDLFKDSKTPLSEEEFSMYFPEELTIINLNSIVNRVKSEFVRTRRIRDRVMIITLPLTESMSTYTLENALKYIWFGDTSKSKSRSFDCYNAYSKAIRWLKLSPDETLKASGYKNHLQLHGFIRSLNNKSRTVSVIGPVRKGGTLHDSLESIILNCYTRKLVLKISQEEFKMDIKEKERMFPTLKESLLLSVQEKIVKETHRKLRNIIETTQFRLWLNYFSPSSGLDKMDYSYKQIEYLSKEIEDLNLFNATWLSKQQKHLVFMAKVRSMTAAKLNDFLFSTIKLPYYSTYLEKQKLNSENKWVGNGIIYVRTRFNWYHIYLKDDEITYVGCHNLETAKRESSIIYSIIRPLKVKMTESKTFPRISNKGMFTKTPSDLLFERETITPLEESSLVFYVNCLEDGTIKMMSGSDDNSLEVLKYIPYAPHTAVSDLVAQIRSEKKVTINIQEVDKKLKSFSKLIKKKVVDSKETVLNCWMNCEEIPFKLIIEESKTNPIVKEWFYNLGEKILISKNLKQKPLLTQLESLKEVAMTKEFRSIFDSVDEQKLKSYLQRIEKKSTEVAEREYEREMQEREMDLARTQFSNQTFEQQEEFKDDEEDEFLKPMERRESEDDEEFDPSLINPETGELFETIEEKEAYEKKMKVTDSSLLPAFSEVEVIDESTDLKVRENEDFTEFKINVANTSYNVDSFGVDLTHSFFEEDRKVETTFVRTPERETPTLKFFFEFLEMNRMRILSILNHEEQESSVFTDEMIFLIETFYPSLLDD